MEVENRSIDGAQEAASEISGADGAAVNEETVTASVSGEDNAEKAFTQSDIDAAIDKARKKWEADQDQAEKLAKMSETEREREENRIEREALKKERAAIEHEKLLNEAAKQLKASGVPESFAARVCGKDADETKTNIDAFVGEWNSAILAAVDEKLKGKTPKSGGEGNSADAMRAIIQKSVKQGF